MEKKLINYIFTALGILVFPIENHEGRKNPATLIFLNFIKEVVEEIDNKIFLDNFSYHWEKVKGKFLLQFDNSFYSSSIKLVYGNINYILQDKNETITHNPNKGVRFSFIRETSKKLLETIKKTKRLQIESGWYKNSFDSYVKKSNQFNYQKD